MTLLILLVALVFVVVCCQAQEEEDQGFRRGKLRRFERFDLIVNNEAVTQEITVARGCNSDGGASFGCRFTGFFGGRQCPRGDEANCDSNSQCARGRCGRRENAASAPRVCCCAGAARTVDVSWSGSNQVICANSPVNFRCETSSDCHAGLVCHNRRCQKGFPDGVVCTRGSECLSRACTRGRCGFLATNTPCRSPGECRSRACALQDGSSTAPRVCCPSRAVLEAVPWSFEQHAFCLGLETGKPCVSDRLCQSNKCQDGACQ